MFDPLSPDFMQNPFPQYEYLRANSPILFRPDLNIWFLAEYEDNSVLLRDNKHIGRNIAAHLTPEELAQMPPLPEEVLPMIMMNSHHMAFNDPPVHTRMRGLVSKAFTPRVVEGMRGYIQDVVNGLIDNIEGRGELDFLEEFALPLPMTVINDLMGIPHSDAHYISKWTDDMLAALDLTADLSVFAAAGQAALDFGQYLQTEIIPYRRQHMGDDIISGMLQAEEAGDTLSEQEIVSTCILMLVGGHETTANVLSNGLYYLLRDPQQKQLIVDNPNLASTAFEEFVRYDGPAHMINRYVLEDFSYKGYEFKKGHEVHFLLGSANRDPKKFERADELDIARQENPNLGWAIGVHFCLGQPLARLEGELAYKTLFQRVPHIELADPDFVPTYRASNRLRVPLSLPVIV